MSYLIGSIPDKELAYLRALAFPNARCACVRVGAGGPRLVVPGKAGWCVCASLDGGYAGSGISGWLTGTGWSGYNVLCSSSRLDESSDIVVV